MFPHSEICGSKLICSSPQLIAAYHVLHRLLMPRHSPYALIRLNFLFLINHFCSYDWSFGSRSLELLEFLEHFGYLYSLVKRFASLHSFSRCFESSTFRWNCIALSCLPNFNLERPIKCVCFICPQISVRFLLKTSIFTLIFLIRLSKIRYLGTSSRACTVSRAGRSGWTRTIDLALIRRAL